MNLWDLNVRREKKKSGKVIRGRSEGVREVFQLNFLSVICSRIER